MRALSRVDKFQSGTKLDGWMFRNAQKRWHDRTRRVRPTSKF
jgi:DNA-directed RNA polymerase specialized sigma24 family protein